MMPPKTSLSPSPRLSLVNLRSTLSLLLPALLFFGIKPNSPLKLMVTLKLPNLVNGNLSLSSPILSHLLVKKLPLLTTNKKILVLMLTSGSLSLHSIKLVPEPTERENSHLILPLLIKISSSEVMVQDSRLLPLSLLFLCLKPITKLLLLTVSE